MAEDRRRTHGRAEETAPEDGDYGFGRSRPLTQEEQDRLAREQGRLIGEGKTRKGHIVLRTRRRRTIVIGVLVGILGLAIVLIALA